MSSGAPTRSGATVVVVGDALLDRDVVGIAERLCPDAPVPVLEEQRSVARPGGAALAAALAAAEGADVTLVTALGADAAGRELSSILRAAGVAVIDMRSTAPTPEKIRLRCGNQSVARLDRNPQRGMAHVRGLPAAAREVLAAARAVLVADYGGGVTAIPGLRQLLSAVTAPLLWDPHRLGARPVPGTLLATPNQIELGTWASIFGRTGKEPSEFDEPWLRQLAVLARQAMSAWSLRGLAVTLGERGAAYFGAEGPPLMVPAPQVTAHDSCGAGDCFSAAAAVALANGALPSEAVAVGVEKASRFVAAGGASSWPINPEPLTGRPAGRASPLSRGLQGLADAVALTNATRAAGGTVVAAGGCFDVLHAGHVQVLQRARDLGDCLVVCMNSDRSVRALKGAGRPVLPERDRAAVLSALECVDAVLSFDEPTPERALKELRPHIFAKGGDYGARDLPEQAVLDEWGGQCVVLPYAEGHSTTRFLALALQR